MRKISEQIQEILKKDITASIKKHKILIASALVVFLLACIGLVATYAYYQVSEVKKIWGSTVGQISDLDIRILVQKRDDEGNAIDGYESYPYIPKAGYAYNSIKSGCANNSTINYDSTTYTASISALGHDVCYLYFDSTANLDLTLYVYAQNINDAGEGIEGDYTLLKADTLPPVGYRMHTANDSYKSRCVNGSEMTYNEREGMINISSTGKDTCYAYMDALDVDIALQIFVEYRKNTSFYYKADSIPTNFFYELNTAAGEHQSSCTGAANADALSLVNQKVTIAATNRTKCVVYLNVAEGPILKSIQSTINNGVNVVLNVESSTNSTAAVKYYFSKDGWKTSQVSTSPTYTYNNLNPQTMYTFEAYSEDASGKKSGIVKIDTETDYYYDNTFAYQAAAYVENVVATGYYTFRVWGAQGGTIDSKPGGFGGYSVGIVYLYKGDVLYINTGGQGALATAGTNGGGGAGGSGAGGGGGTDIRINGNTLYHRVIVAGGGGGASQDSCGTAVAGFGGGPSGGGGVTLASSCGKQGMGGTQTAGGTGGVYSGTTGASGTFGTGGTATDGSWDGGGGGGGWYGGGAGATAQWSNSGGGGSGYVFTEENQGNYPSRQINSKYWLIDAITISGDPNMATGFEAPSGNGAVEKGHAGNGTARITYIGRTLPTA